MDIKITQPNLMKALQTIAPAAAPNPGFPVGINVLINATATNKILFNTYNSDILINYTGTAVEVPKAGQVLVEHKMLYHWTARTKSDKIIRLSLETDKDGIKQLHCRAARSHVRLGITNPKDFPDNPFKAHTRWIIPSKYIREGLATTSNPRIGLPEKFDGETWRAMNGTHLRISPTYITIETCSYTYGAFYYNAHNVENIKTNLDIIIPSKISGILQTTLPDNDTLILLEINESQSLLKIKLDETEWHTTLIKPTFPDTSPFYSTKTPIIYGLKVDSADIRNAIQTAEIFMEEASDPILMWSLPDENNNITLALKSLGNEKGNYEGQLDIVDLVENSEDDKPLRIAGSIQQLSKIFNILRTSPILHIEIKNKENPRIHIRGNMSPNTFYVTMPIKIKDD